MKSFIKEEKIPTIILASAQARVEAALTRDIDLIEKLNHFFQESKEILGDTTTEGIKSKLDSFLLELENSQMLSTEKTQIKKEILPIDYFLTSIVARDNMTPFNKKWPLRLINEMIAYQGKKKVVEERELSIIISKINHLVEEYKNNPTDKGRQQLKLGFTAISLIFLCAKIAFWVFVGILTLAIYNWVFATDVLGQKTHE